MNNVFCKYDLVCVLTLPDIVFNSDFVFSSGHRYQTSGILILDDHGKCDVQLYMRRSFKKVTKICPYYVQICL